MSERLKYLSVKALQDLYGDIGNNLDKYRQGDFSDLAAGRGWGLELGSVEIKKEFIDKLDCTSGTDGDAENALLVYQGLKGMTPSLACEDRVWTRLCHIECLDYSRHRWLDLEKDDAGLRKDIETHLFAGTLVKYRDDNAVSRLWWTAHIAMLAYPHDHTHGVNIIFRKQDIRKNFVERALIVNRPHLSGAIVRGMVDTPWITAKEDNFRQFMVTINNFGGGNLFEAMDDSAADAFVKKCTAMASEAA